MLEIQDTEGCRHPQDLAKRHARHAEFLASHGTNTPALMHALLSLSMSVLALTWDRDASPGDLREVAQALDGLGRDVAAAVSYLADTVENDPRRI